MDTDTEDYDGSSPIHRACEKGNIGMLTYLLSKGASYNLIDREGNTPMALAVKNRLISVNKYAHAQIIKKMKKIEQTSKQANFDGTTVSNCSHQQ